MRTASLHRLTPCLYLWVKPGYIDVERKRQLSISLPIHAAIVHPMTRVRE